MFKRMIVVIELLVLCSVLPACNYHDGPGNGTAYERRKAGIHLGENYETSVATINAAPSIRIRYVFEDSSATIYEKLRDDSWASCWIINIHGTDRLVFCRKKQAEDRDVPEGLVVPYNGYTSYPNPEPPVQPAYVQTEQGDGGYKETYNWYRPSDLDAIAVGNPGGWYAILKDAPIQYEDRSVRVDWGSCDNQSACTDFGNNSDSEVLNVESGLILKRSSDPTFQLMLAQ